MIIFYFLFFIFYFFLSWFRPKWALVLICALLPIYQFRFKLFWLPLTVLEAMILVLFFVYLLRNTKEITKIRKKIGSWRWPILAWLAVATLAMFIAPDLWAGAGVWRAYFIEPVLFLIVFLSLVKSRRDLNLILAALGVSALYSSVWAIGQRFFGGGVLSQEVLGAPKIWRATGPFSHPNFLGLYLGPITLLFFSQIVSGLRLKIKDLRKIIFYSFCILLPIIAVILARSEGAVLGIAAGLIFLGLINKTSRKWVGLSLVILLLVISFLPLVRDYIWQKATFQDLSGQLRVNIWQGTFSLIKVSPVLGVGLGGYQKLIPGYQEPFYQPLSGQLVSVETHPYPHNIFLTIWCELGLAGLIIFCWILIKFFRDGFKKSKLVNSHSFFVISLMGAMVTLIIHGCVDTPYFKNDLAVLFWLIIGIHYEITKLLRNTKSYESTKN